MRTATTEEWNNSIGQQELENKRYDDALKKEDELRAKEEAKAQADALLAMGQMPSNELLAAAGYDAAYATAYIAGVKAELARQNSSKSSNSPSNDGTKKEKVEDDVVVNPYSPKKTGEMTTEELVAKAAKEVSSPNLTSESLGGMLDLGWIVYDDKEDKFKRTMDFGKGAGIQGAGFKLLQNGF